MSEQALKQKPTAEAAKRPTIGTQVLAVVLMLSMVVLTFTTTRKDKAWKAWVKKLGIEQVEPVDSKKK